MSLVTISMTPRSPGSTRDDLWRVRTLLSECIECVRWGGYRRLRYWSLKFIQTKCRSRLPYNQIRGKQYGTDIFTRHTITLCQVQLLPRVLMIFLVPCRVMSTGVYCSGTLCTGTLCTVYSNHETYRHSAGPHPTSILPVLILPAFCRSSSYRHFAGP